MAVSFLSSVIEEIIVSRTIMLMPVGCQVDLTKATLNIANALENANIKFGFLKPLAQPEGESAQSAFIALKEKSSIETAEPISCCYASRLIASGKKDVMLEEVVALYEPLRESNQVVLIEGLSSNCQYPFVDQVNMDVAKALGAEVIFVINKGGYTAEQVNTQIAVANLDYAGLKAGVIVNESGYKDEVSALPMLGDADTICADWIKSLSVVTEQERRLSPPAFRYQLSQLARKAQKRIVLPEGDEPRTVKAAAMCAERGIATCVLLGEPESIQRVAKEQGVTLGAGIEIINPADEREKYVARFVELRKKKGLTPEQAREQLQDNVVLGTLMLEQDDVDGLVSGAVHTTANTIRPPLQLIKTAPGSSLVSSVFFMLMPDQVYFYGDCAINPEPNAEELAEIAIQSAETAIAFGFTPRVAMLSYSTGTSGKGESVEKVTEATRIAQEKRPDLMIDGPLQYDASVMPDVAKSKAPNSKVAGRANVFIFPDLNAGNIGYKAVQRSANLLSVGPLLQGMRKPVNDLSRGALVDDIIYTIALTAVQAAQAEQAK